MNQFRIDVAAELVLRLAQEPSYGRLLAKKLQVPLTTVQRELHTLTTQKVLLTTTQGRNILHTLRRSPQARAKFTEAEAYALRKCLAKYPLLEPIISDMQATTNAPILIFGSYARGNATEKSDIDIHVATDKTTQRKIEAINTKLSVKTGTLSDEPLSREIKRTHVIVQGIEQYYAAFAQIQNN